MRVPGFETDTQFKTGIQCRCSVYQMAIYHTANSTTPKKPPPSLPIPFFPPSFFFFLRNKTSKAKIVKERKYRHNNISSNRFFQYLNCLQQYRNPLCEHRKRAIFKSRLMRNNIKWRTFILLTKKSILLYLIMFTSNNSHQKFRCKWRFLFFLDQKVLPLFSCFVN